jgi:hypothetical protein
MLTKNLAGPQGAGQVCIQNVVPFVFRKCERWRAPNFGDAIHENVDFAKPLKVSVPKMLSGANAVEISDIQEEKSRAGPKKVQNLVLHCYTASTACHCINSLATGNGTASALAKSIRRTAGGSIRRECLDHIIEQPEKGHVTSDSAGGGTPPPIPATRRLVGARRLRRRSASLSRKCRFTLVYPARVLLHPKLHSSGQPGTWEDSPTR